MLGAATSANADIGGSNGDNMTAVTTVLLSPGTSVTVNCDPSARTPAHVASQTAANIVLDQLAAFAPGQYRIITVSGFESCCTGTTVTLP